MNCYECALKHLAAGVSYAKEIMAGHGRGNPLDHRIDLLGELSNAEHHLEMLKSRYAENATSLRRLVQQRRNVPTAEEVDKMRELFLNVESENETKLAAAAARGGVAAAAVGVAMPEKKPCGCGK